jgi:hypothetical protein
MTVKDATFLIGDLESGRRWVSFTMLQISVIVTRSDVVAIGR